MKNRKYIIILVAIVFVVVVGFFIKYNNKTEKSSDSGCLPLPHTFIYDSREELVKGIYEMDLTNVDAYNHKSLLNTWHRYQELGYLYDVNVKNEDFVKKSRTAFRQASSDDAHITYFFSYNGKDYKVHIMSIDDTIGEWTTFKEYIEKRYEYTDPYTVTINDKEVVMIDSKRLDDYYAYGQIDSNYYFYVSRNDSEWEKIIESIELEKFELIPEETITTEEIQ